MDFLLGVGWAQVEKERLSHLQSASSFLGPDDLERCNLSYLISGKSQYKENVATPEGPSLYSQCRHIIKFRSEILFLFHFEVVTRVPAFLPNYQIFHQ